MSVPEPTAPSVRVEAKNPETWPTRWRFAGFNSCGTKARQVLESMLETGEVPASMARQALAQIVYELKLTEGVLEQRARAAGHSLPGEELLERVERRLFTMPADNAEQILAIQAHARSLVHDLDVVATLAASPRGMALLRTVHCLATDIDGPGFEMWND